MKIKILLTAITFATLTTTSAQNLIIDGGFESTTVGNFTLPTSVANTVPLNVWAAYNPTAGDVPTIAVASGITGATGSNCASFIQNAAKSGRLYQRLSSTAINSTSKSYKLTAKVKCATGSAGVYIYIRNKNVYKYAVRTDWKSGDLYPGIIYSVITTAWTTVSATFSFSTYCDGEWSQAPTYNVAFTPSELQDLYVGISGGRFSTTDPMNTVYFDDVVLEEVTSAPIPSAATTIGTNSFTANWGAVDGASGYQLDVSTNNTFTQILASYNNLSVSGTSQVVKTGLTDNTTYYYRVRAVSATLPTSGNSQSITATTSADPSFVKNGKFTSSTLAADLYLNNLAYGTVRNTWGCMNKPADATPPTCVISDNGVGGAGDNCVAYTRSTTEPSTHGSVNYLFQRLSATAGTLSLGKTYRLSIKAKATLPAGVTTYPTLTSCIKMRSTQGIPNNTIKYAVRADWVGGEYPGALQSLLTADWKTYQTDFIFSRATNETYKVATVVSAADPNTNFTDADLQDLIVAFFTSSSTNVPSFYPTIYIDDVQLVEYTGPGLSIELGDVSTVAVNITGDRGVTKNKIGVTTLSGNNTYTGSTQVNAGTLSVTGSLSGTSFIQVNGGAGLANLTSLPFAQPLVLIEGATLSGNGASVTAFSPVSISVTGDIAYGFAPIAVQSGTLVKSGQLTLTLTNPVNGSYTLFSGTTTGTFSSISCNGVTLTASGNGDFSGSDGQVTYAFTNASNLLFLTGAPATIHPAPLRLASNGAMLLNGQPLKALGVNYYDSFYRTLVNPSDKTSYGGLAELSALGIPCIRFDLSGSYPIYANLFFTNREEYFRRLDDFVAEAEKRGIGLVPVFFWTPYVVCDIFGEHLDQLAVTNSLTRQKMREFTQAVVTRYKNSPAIWIWELGNEWNLNVDLPNFTSFPFPTNTSKGYPATRDMGTYGNPGQDALFSDRLIPAIKEFATQVKALDPDRPVSTGFAAPRNCAWHLDQTWRGLLPAGDCWTVDSYEQAKEIARRHTPSPYDLLSLHVYIENYADFGKNTKIATDLGLGLFVGEFGASASHPVTLFPNMLKSVKDTADLALMWNYDRFVSDVPWNVTSTNSRNYMLKALLPTNPTNQKLIADGGFSATATGGFTLKTGVNLADYHNVWGGVNTNTGEITSPTIGVVAGVAGASGNCAVFAPGTTTPTATTAFLFQRLSFATGMTVSKNYRLNVKLKALSGAPNGYLFLKKRDGNFALRRDWSSGDSYAGCKFINGVNTSWTDYSQSFIFTNSIVSVTESANPSGTPFVDEDLNDLMVGFYATGGTVYVDDVELVEDTTSIATEAAAPQRMGDVKFLVVKGRQITILVPTGEVVTVYNMTGQLVCKSNKAVFELNKSGLYIVKMGNKTQRVIIN